MDNLRSHRLHSFSSNYFTSLSEKITTLEREGNVVIRLDIGSPDLPPPREVIERLQAAASQPANHGYQSHRGTIALRQAWTNHYQKFHRVKLDPDAQILYRFKQGHAWIRYQESILFHPPRFGLYSKWFT